MVAPSNDEHTASQNRRKLIKALAAAGVTGLAGCGSGQNDGQGNGGDDETDSEDDGGTNGNGDSDLPQPEIDSVDVEFGHEPFVDHTQAILGIEQGWFEEVGITITPEESNGKNAGAADAPAFLGSGSADVVSGSIGLYTPSLQTYPEIRMLSFADLFKGFAIMATDNYTSYWEFVDEGLNKDEAVRRTIQQLTEGTLLLSDAPVLRGFLNVALDRGDLTLEGLDTTVQSPTQHVATMEAGRADFEVGGAPFQVELRQLGYKNLIDAGILVQAAEPSRDSEALTTVFRDGWMSTKSWIENNRAVALRMAAVNFKINEYIVNKPNEAAQTHIPFLNELAGTDLKPEDVQIFYEELHPFYTFEEQQSWFHDKEDSLYYEYQVGAWIDSSVEDDVLEEGKWTVDNIQMASDVYYALEEHKAAADEQIAAAEDAIEAAPDGSEKEQAQEYLDRARELYDLYDFYDADRFSEAAVTWAENA